MKQQLTTRQAQILETLNLKVSDFEELNTNQIQNLVNSKYLEYQNNLKQIACANTFPVIINKNPTAIVEHEATAGKISQDTLLYIQSRGLTEENAVSMIVAGYCQDIFVNLPFEFAVEAKNLLQMKIEGF